MSITKETRLESYLKTECSNREKLILSALTKPMTARQVAQSLGFTERNAVAPRLTEMVDKGWVEIAGKAYDKVSKRNVAVYRKVV